MTWILWALVLHAQAASTTWASRARNSASIPYHAIASTFSHGVWFCSNLILSGSIFKLLSEGPLGIEAFYLGVFYTFFCVSGSVTMHYVSSRLFETGKRKVGA